MRPNAGGDGKTIPGDGMTLADMRIALSADGQYLLIYCRNRIVAMLGPMGGDVDVFEFADVGRMTAMDLIGRL